MNAFHIVYIRKYFSHCRDVTNELKNRIYFHFEVIERENVTETMCRLIAQAQRKKMHCFTFIDGSETEMREKNCWTARDCSKKKATLKCETKWGVFACNMGLGLFKRDQIIYNCVIIIIIIELRAHTNKRPLNDLKSIRENSFQFSDKCCSNQSRPTESDRFEWRIDDTENK